MKSKDLLKSVVPVAVAFLIGGCTGASKQGAPDTNGSGSGQIATTTTATNTDATNTDATNTDATSAAKASTEFVSYEAALASAKQQNKLIFVDIYTDWCVWCKRLEQDVYPKPEVKDAFAKRFVLTKMNAESDASHTFMGGSRSERDITGSWNVNAFPTLVFLDTTERPVYAYEGYLPPEQFVKLLTYVGSGDYKSTPEFRVWLSQHGG